MLGPEAPLIALGGGLGLCAVRLSRREVPAEAAAVVAASGSFAAISALLGSPILRAFLLMEAAGLGGATLGLVLLPGLLSAGIGTLVFVGLDALTGYGLVSLGLPGLPMCVVMLALPMTSVLLATLLLFSDGLAVMPLVIVAVVVAHVSGPATSSDGTTPSGW